MALSGSEFSGAVFQHIEDTLRYFDDLGVKHWDVINEMVDQGSTSHTFYQVGIIFFFVIIHTVCMSVLLVCPYFFITSIFQDFFNLQDQSGDSDIRVKIHKHVRELSPQTKIYVNDYGIILDKHNRFALFQQLLRDLISAGAPVDAIGLQCHIKGGLEILE